MKQKNQILWYAALASLIAFVLWTVLLCTVDVQPIGPQGSYVGLATLNGAVHSFFEVNMLLYTVTDWFALVPLAVVCSFALLGVCQWVRRKRLRLVDRNVLVLGVFYLVVMAVFLLFEIFAINYRPVLIDGVPEASYPSSTTMLVLCVMPTAMIVLGRRIRHTALRVSLLSVMGVFTAFMLIGRVISAVHWLTDIVGGMLLSGGLVSLYRAVLSRVEE